MDQWLHSGMCLCGINRDSCKFALNTAASTLTESCLIYYRVSRSLLSVRRQSTAAVCQRYTGILRRANRFALCSALLSYTTLFYSARLDWLDDCNRYLRA
jgi:hypothetical protein